MVATLALVTACGHRSPIDLSRVGQALESAAPGDTIIVRDGSYSDVNLSWQGRGSAEQPIVVMSQSPLGVQISGRSHLSIYGEGLEVNSFDFTHCSADKGAIIEFRSGDSLASHCRLTQSVMDSCNPARRDISYSYIHLYGRDNRVDHCSLLGKKNLGVTLIVMLNYDGCDDNHHSIDHNWFGPRPVYGSNGAETIRVGTSQQCMQPSRTQIHDNLFDRCNGEVEVVSIKSCDNVISDNTFYECQGVLALRHGDRNRAEGNLFIGHSIRNTGGIRIVGEDQVVRGNKFLSLAGSRFFSALALMCGVPNSLPNRYMQVKRAQICDNVFEGCKSLDFACGADYERTLGPEGTIFTNNTIVTTQTSEEPSYESLLSEVGASAYKAEAVRQVSEPREIVVSESEWLLDHTIDIIEPTVIRAAEGVSPEVKWVGSKSDYMITIRDGGSLVVRGLSFNGVLTAGRSLAKGIISTAEDMIEPYSLRIEDCVFENCGEGGFVPVRGLKGTFADSVVIRGCTFRALSGDGINYAGEVEDKGRYNGDDLIIEDCHFERVLGLPINVARLGSDESTAGPYVHINRCEFNDCCNKARGSVIRVIGAQELELTDNRFIDSGRGGYSIRLDEAPWEWAAFTIGGNTFVNSGRMLSNYHNGR